MNDELLEKITEIMVNFSIMIGQMSSDIKQDNFKVDKFVNQMNDFCDDSIRKIRGF